jgi:hypothetical protein
MAIWYATDIPTVDRRAQRFNPAIEFMAIGIPAFDEPNPDFGFRAPRKFIVPFVDQTQT